MAIGDMTPDAAFVLEEAGCGAERKAPTLFFFKGNRYFRWDVAREALRDGDPRAIDEDWPGLRASARGRSLRGALHVPDWGARIFFLFEGGSRALVWNIEAKAVEEQSVDIAELLPSRLTRADFTPLFARTAGGEAVVYAFSGQEYTRWTVASFPPRAEDDGFPRRIDADWKDGLLLAPRSALYVDWPNRSPAHSNRKLYFFMGDLYLRWDVPSHTRNYRLDIMTGWKGWPLATQPA